MNQVEEKLLTDHRKWFEQLTGFICMVCLMPKKKPQLGRIFIFRPAKKYKLARTASCITCDDCEKLPAAEIYAGLEKYLMERGHLEL
jgi:succinate dehydrogenase/fumarate reductase-like Fe-S protein